MIILKPLRVRHALRRFSFHRVARVSVRGVAPHSVRPSLKSGSGSTVKKWFVSPLGDNETFASAVETSPLPLAISMATDCHQRSYPRLGESSSPTCAADRSSRCPSQVPSKHSGLMPIGLSYRVKYLTTRYSGRSEASKSRCSDEERIATWQRSR
jgi:hypothetical protein